MSPIVILLIILGLIFVFASFFISAKFDEEDKNSVIEIPEELKQEQKEKIDKLLADYMDEKVDSKLSDVESRFAELINEKTLALGDYAVTVNEEIERNHSEVMFLYSMLSDKQKEIMTTATMVDDYRKDVEAFVQANQILNQTFVSKEDAELSAAVKEIDDSISEDTEDAPNEPVDSSREVILEMHKSGLSILEIAKHLGLGVGEVKLVVDLYQGETKA
ncbi:MAG: DUF6115 domain-containing protein [Lachnospiraceae bacterium]|nr:DUF6115 domain-containing protein [Lachnospiraceae bacterium]